MAKTYDFEMIDHDGKAHTVTGHIAGPMRKGSKNLGSDRYTIAGANHPKGDPIRFKSMSRLQNYIRDHRGLQMRAV